MEADDDEDDGTPPLTPWLDEMAPSYARLYLRRGSPLWYAVNDLRAAMILDSWGDASSLGWVFEAGLWDRASSTLESCGLIMPEALFNRVRRICRESAGVPLPEARVTMETVHDADAWARWWLFDAARDALRLGLEEASRRRYGCGR